MIPTSGRWSPDAAPLTFVVEPQTYHTRPAGLPVLVAASDLVLTGRLREADVARLLELGEPVLLDSGVYALAAEHARTHNLPIAMCFGLPPSDLDGFAELRDGLLAIASKYRDELWGVIELDAGGAVHKRVNRLWMRDEGVCPIPVYHPLVDDPDYFDELAADSDRCAIGNVVQARTPDRVRMLCDVAYRRRAFPELRWIHALGVRPGLLPFLTGYESSDVSTGTSVARWGQLYTTSLGSGFDQTYVHAEGAEARLGVGVGELRASALNWHHYVGRLTELLGAES